MIHEAKRKMEEESSNKILNSSFKKKDKAICDPFRKFEKVENAGIDIGGIPPMEILVGCSNAPANPLGTFDWWIRQVIT